MPTKTATLQESGGSSKSDALRDSPDESVVPVSKAQNGKTLPGPSEDQNDPSDSEAETEHIDASPSKKRALVQDTTRNSKRSRVLEPERVESTANGAGSVDEEIDPSDRKSLGGATNISHGVSEESEAAGPVNGRARSGKRNVTAGATLPGAGLEKNRAGTEENESVQNLSSAPEAEDSGAEQDVEANEANTEDSHDDEENDEEQAALQKQRQEAIGFLTEIEIQFAEFRNQVHEDQMARYELEIQMCLDGSHPELSSIESSIKSRHDERIDRGRALYEYQLQCIQNQTKAMRAQLHQQFLRERFDLRSDLLSQTTRKWYQVNYERRAADKMVPDYGYSGIGQDPVSKGPVLAAIQKFVGFPAAPRVSAASFEEKTEDLAALGLY